MDKTNVFLGCREVARTKETKRRRFEVQTEELEQEGRLEGCDSHRTIFGRVSPNVDLPEEL